jgi:1-acylglycerone phosphate reductase
LSLICILLTSGTIINIGSIASYTSQPFWAAYSASKSALMSVTDAMRTELKPLGVKVVYCAPGESCCSMLE